MKTIKKRKVKLYKVNISGRFLIRIKKSSKPTYWYDGAWYVGKDFRVKWNPKYKKWQVIGKTKYIQKRDAIILKTIR